MKAQKKAHFAAVTAVLLVSAFLFACGSSTQSEQAPATTDASGASATAASTQASSGSGPVMKTGSPSGEYTEAVLFVTPVNGQWHIGPAPTPLWWFMNTVNEYLFSQVEGDLMSPNLATSWEVNSSGTEATITIQEGIPWQPPHGQESLDFGFMTAEDVAQVMNVNNSRINPDAHVRAPVDQVYLDARAVSANQVKAELAQPVGFAWPLISGGPMSITGLPIYLTRSIESMGVDWAKENPVGTGPFVQGECVPNEFCKFHAVSEHWRMVPEIATYKLLRVEDPLTSSALLKTGQIDATPFVNHAEVAELEAEGFRFIRSRGFTGQSVIWGGNYWEQVHARTGEPLNPWEGGSYRKDFPWIGDPWQEIAPDKVAYVDDNNPPGMTDMEQARLVRLALEIAIDREKISEDSFGGIPAPLYSEYMGPHYEGWDAERTSGAWTFTGERIEPSASQQPVQWQLDDGNLAEAGRLLTLAGYPLVDGKRPAFGDDLILLSFPAEIGPGYEPLGIAVVDAWIQLGIEASILVENYGGVIAPVITSREQVLPLIKNGDVANSTYPLDAPFPPTDSSLTRPLGQNFGFESPYLAEQHLAMLASPDKQFREEQHLNVADYMLYWRLYGGLIQIPKGHLVTERTESWLDPRSTQGGLGEPGAPEYIVLRR